MRNLSTLALSLALLAPSVAAASGLDDYKDQKHGDRTRVTKDNCEEVYMAENGLSPSDPGAYSKAQEFCDERAKQKVGKTIEVVAKGASVGAGAAAVAAENAVAARAVPTGGSNTTQTASDTHNGVTKSGPRPSTSSGSSGSSSSATHGNVTKGVSSPSAPPPPVAPRVDPWSVNPIFVAELGGGLMGGAGAGQGMVRGRFARDSHFGAGVSSSILADSDDWLSETDVGPVLYLDSKHIEFGLQPSLLVSAGNGVQTALGGGARSYTTVELGRVGLHFDPMLGYINHQWNYDLKVGASYRFTPNVYGRVSYDYRDVLDLGDLELSQTAMHGVIGTVGVRF